MQNTDKIPVVAVVGPTASGKTALGIELAKRFNGEVVSADSMQIYRELSVATAKPMPEEMQGVPHHMIDIASVNDDFSVAMYCSEAKKCIADIYARNKLPIIVGGTGLYVDSLLKGYDFSLQDTDEKLRAGLNAEYDEIGGERMLEKLRKVDENAAKNVHANNKKRLVRYLELYELTGLTESERAKKNSSLKSPYRPLYICITCRDRQKLYDRINRRVDKMIENGLVDEVKRYYTYKNAKTASQAIGCKELKPYLDGADTLENCVERLKQATRRYAKRQLTWFLRNERINLVFTDETGYNDIIENVSELTEKFLKGESE